jgi:hypothetical protein
MVEDLAIQVFELKVVVYPFVVEGTERLFPGRGKIDDFDSGIPGRLILALKMRGKIYC